MNIILYVLDALRADHVSCYGYERNTTPVLDEFAEDGVRFDQCISPSTWTRPVAGSILSGYYPAVHGIHGSNDRFDPSTPALQELLREAGYQTLAICSGNMDSKFGFDRGFDDYIDDIAKGVDDTDELTFAGTRGYEINQAFEDWYETADDTPFFAMLWSTGPHAPYAPPEGFREWVDEDYDGPVDGHPQSMYQTTKERDRQQLIGLYDGEIRYNDYCLGQLRELLEANGEYEDTYIICVGDHGEGFGELPEFYGHGGMPFEGVIHVPCIVRTPGDVAGERIGKQVSLVDLYPTLVDLATDGQETETEASIQATSFAPAVDGENIPGSEYVYADRRAPSGDVYQTIRTTDWKYLTVESADDDSQPTDDVSTNGSARGSASSSDTSSDRSVLDFSKLGLTLVRKVLRTERTRSVLLNPYHYYRYYARRNRTAEFLFNLKSDPTEQSNLVGKRPDRRDEFRDRLDSWRAECATLRTEVDAEAGAVDIDDELREHLKKLGYVDDY